MRFPCNRLHGRWVFANRFQISLGYRRQHRSGERTWRGPIDNLEFSRFRQARILDRIGRMVATR